MTRWRINITLAEVLVLVVATILVVEAVRGALSCRAGVLLFALAVLAEAAALLHTVHW